MGQSICQESATAKSIYNVASDILGYDILETMKEATDEDVRLTVC